MLFSISPNRSKKTQIKLLKRYFSAMLEFFSQLRNGKAMPLSASVEKALCAQYSEAITQLESLSSRKAGKYIAFGPHILQQALAASRGAPFQPFELKPSGGDEPADLSEYELVVGSAAPAPDPGSDQPAVSSVQIANELFAKGTDIHVSVQCSEDRKWRWTTGTICAIKEGKLLLHVTSHKTRLWVPQDSRSIAPKGTYTRAAPT